MTDRPNFRQLGEAAGSAPTVPRAALIAAACAIAITIGGATLGRVNGAGAPTPETSALIVSRTLTFADRADGAVVITDASTGQSVEVLQGENGFIRGTLRAMARERRMKEASFKAPFRLSAWEDGRLTLDDTVTGRRLELTSFGHTNAGEFARMLPQPAAPAPFAEHGSQPARTAAR